jgi:hypothetical protein
VAARRAGQAKSSQAFFSPLKHRGAADPWSRCARAEAWLIESRQDQPPIPTMTCAAAAVRPKLDGILDEPYWAVGSTVPSEADAPNVRWAHDTEYLYAAIECAKRPGLDYGVATEPRPRDGDVESHDHVRLRIDVDRDYASYFELFVDSRGCTADRCCGDAAWNPQWFVARGESAGGGAWTIEAAIPLSELSTTPLSPGEAWAGSAARFSPSAAAPTPGHKSDPAEFSLLLFE